MDFLFLDLNSSVAGVFAILILSYYVLQRSRNAKVAAAKGRRPPKAAGAWPLIGHLHLLTGQELPHRTLGAMADIYGPIFTIKIGMHRALVVSSWELAKECLTTHDVTLASRPKYISGKILGPNFVAFGFAPYDAYWLGIRRIVHAELMSNHKLESFKHYRTSEVQEFIKEIYNLWNTKRDNSGHAVLEMKQLVSNLTINVIMRMVIGKRYSTATSATDQNEAKRCQKAMREFFRLMGQFVVGDTVPFLRWLDLGGHMKAMTQVGKEMVYFVDKWVEEHNQKRDLGKTSNEQDFLDVLTSALESTNLAGGHDIDTVRKGTCLGILAGGTDTSSIQLTWSLTLLLNNPHVLKKAQDELDIQVGRERLVNESDISKLVYLQAIVKESLRLYPAAPLGGQREFAEDCIVGGYYVPKGTRLVMNLWKIHHDPRVWLDSSKFQPERFISTNMDIDVKGQHFQLLPFSGGRRICPGTSYALHLMHQTLGSLLQAFDLSTPSNAPVDTSEDFGQTNSKVAPLEVVLSPRLPPHLYK